MGGIPEEVAAVDEIEEVDGGEVVEAGEEMATISRGETNGQGITKHWTLVISNQLLNKGYSGL